MKTKTKVKGKRTGDLVPLYLMVPLAALMSPLRQALFGDEWTYMHTQHTQRSLLKLWMNARGLMDMKKYTTQLGLPPTTVLKTLRGIGVALEAELGYEEEGRNQLAMIARDAHLPDMVAAGDEEILRREIDWDILHQGGGRHSEFEGSLISNMGGIAALKAEEFMRMHAMFGDGIAHVPVIQMTTQTVGTAVDVTEEEMVVDACYLCPSCRDVLGREDLSPTYTFGTAAA